MKIKQATMCDFEKIMSFYNVMCEVLGEKDFGNLRQAERLY